LPPTPRGGRRPRLSKPNVSLFFDENDDADSVRQRAAPSRRRRSKEVYLFSFVFECSNVSTAAQKENSRAAFSASGWIYFSSAPLPLRQRAWGGGRNEVANPELANKDSSSHILSCLRCFCKFSFRASFKSAFFPESTTATAKFTSFFKVFSSKIVINPRFVPVSIQTKRAKEKKNTKLFNALRLLLQFPPPLQNCFLSQKRIYL